MKDKREMKSPAQVTLEIKNLSNDYIVIRKEYNKLRGEDIRDEDLEVALDSIDTIISTLTIFLHTGVLIDGALMEMYDFHTPTGSF